MFANSTLGTLMACVIVISSVAACDTDTSSPKAGPDLSLPVWRISERPLSLLKDDGKASTMFQGVQVRRLANGVLLAADVGSGELRVFRDGVVSARLSRSGNGPGELQGRFTITVEKDTIFAIGGFDSRYEVSIFTVGNGFLSRFRLKPPTGSTGFVPVGRLSSGEFVVEEGRGWAVVTSVPELGRLVPDSVTISMFDRGPPDSVGTVHKIGRYRRRWNYAHRWPGGPMPTALSTYPLGPTTVYGVSGGLLWLADTETGEIQAFDGNGQRKSAGMLPLKPQPFNDHQLKRAKQTAVRRADNDYSREQAEAMYDRALLPAAMPLFDGLLPGHGGEVWIRLFQLEPGDSMHYLVLDAAGTAVAQVAIPTALRIHQVGWDFVLGVRTDHDGLEEIVEYLLSRLRKRYTAGSATR